MSHDTLDQRARDYSRLVTRDPADERAAARLIVLSEVRLYGDVLTRSLAEQPGISECIAAAGAAEALALLDGCSPAVVLVDMGRSGSASIVRALRAARPTAVVIAFAVGEREEDVIASAEAGVTAFVQTTATVGELIEVVQRACRGELLCSPKLMASIFRHLRIQPVPATAEEHDELTRREREVVSLIDSGMSNKEIGQRLNIEVATVKNHVHRILEKLAVRRRGEAAARVRRRSRQQHEERA